VIARINTNLSKKAVAKYTCIDSSGSCDEPSLITCTALEVPDFADRRLGAYFN